MALNWDISKIENYKELMIFDSDQVNWNPRHDVEGLIWLSMICGFDRISEKNIDDVIERVLVYEEALGAFRSSPIGPVRYTPDEIRRCLGLTTNAATKTKTQFKNDLYSTLINRVERILKCQK